MAIILPLLFGLFPLFFLYAQNAEEMMIQDLIIPILQVIGFSLVVTTLFGFIFKNFLKSGLIAAILLFSYFSSGHIVRILPELGLSLGNFVLQTGHFLFIFWLVVVIPLFFLIIRTKKDLKSFASICTTIGAFLILIQIVQAGFILITRKNVIEAEEVSAPDAIENIQGLPDVYFIMLDGYAREDLLAELFNVNNSPFINSLKEKGFYVPDESYSHYCQTIFSLGSILNMNYVDALGTFDASSKDRMPMSRILRNNQVMKYFKGAGYSIAAFATGYSHTEMTSADVYFKPSGSMSEFENVLLTTTMFPFSQSTDNSLFAKHRKRVLYTLNKIPNITEVASPKFVFAAIVSPHPPFIFDEDGQPVQQSNSFHMADGSHYIRARGGSRENYIKGYAGQITYLTKLVKIMIDKIFEQYPENKPVIILLADHGSGSGLKWESLETSNLIERFAILNAYYFPGYEENPAYENISPINVFRILFNTYFGTRLELLPIKNYFTRWSHPYDFHDITDRLPRKSQNGQNSKDQSIELTTEENSVIDTSLTGS